MNERRLSRLKRLATGAALVSATLALGDDPKTQKPNVNSPRAPEPIYVNSPAPQAPEDAGVKEEPKPAPKPRGPNVNSPSPVKPKAK
jgi:hypothetical protein